VLYKFISSLLYVYLLYCILHCNTPGQFGAINSRVAFMQLASVITNTTQAQIELTAVIEHSASLLHIDNLHSRNHQQPAALYINISSSSSPSSTLSKRLITFVFVAVFLQLIIIIITKSYTKFT